MRCSAMLALFRQRLQRLLEQLLERGAVHQARQLVGPGQLADAVVRLGLFGHVLEDDDDIAVVHFLARHGDDLAVAQPHESPAARAWT